MSTKRERRAKRKAKKSASSLVPSSSKSRPAPSPSRGNSGILTRFARQVERTNPNIKIVQNPPGQEKMSVALARFIRPYAGHFDDDVDIYRRFVMTAVIAWNAANLDGEKRADFLDEMEKTVPPDMRQEFRQIIEKLMKRKVRHFANNRRTIFKCEVTELDDDYHLSVFSSLAPMGETSNAAGFPGAFQKPSLWARLWRRFVKG